MAGVIIFAQVTSSRRFSLFRQTRSVYSRSTIALTLAGFGIQPTVRRALILFSLRRLFPYKVINLPLFLTFAASTRQPPDFVLCTCICTCTLWSMWGFLEWAGGSVVDGMVDQADVFGGCWKLVVNVSITCHGVCGRQALWDDPGSVAL